MLAPIQAAIAQAEGERRAALLISDVNVGGGDGPYPGAPPEHTVGTVTLPYFGDDHRRQLWRELDHLRRTHIEKYEPVTVTVRRDVLVQAINALRHRDRHRAIAQLQEALGDA